MNEIIRSLKDRKSVRAFKEIPVETAHKSEILNAALEAPSAGNMTLYTIIDITDQKLKDTLAITCDNQPFIAKAPLVLVFCADYYRWYHAFCRHSENVRKPSYGDLNLATADALIAAQNTVVAAESLGVGSCYIGDITERFEEHRELLSLPRYVVPVCMLVMGYPTEQQKKREKPRRFDINDIVHTNGYQREKSDKMEDMLKVRQNISEDAISEYIHKFCKRKYNSDFSREMSRSCEEMLKSFCEE